MKVRSDVLETDKNESLDIKENNILTNIYTTNDIYRSPPCLNRTYFFFIYIYLLIAVNVVYCLFSQFVQKKRDK